MSLQSLKEKNQYPIVFIGSGMSKRFITNSPDWLTLLEEYWDKINQSTDFYSYLNNLRKEVSKNNPDYSDEQLQFKINAFAASFIQTTFDKLYDSDNTIVPDLTPKKVFQENLSPFKYSVSKRFSKLNFIPEKSEEISEFSKVLGKSKMIVTTNYDLMIEKLLKKENKSADVFIGNTGFFNDTTGWNELFKIHGTAENANSIIITESDYEKFDHNALLLNAKLLTSLIDSPIVFLGYSLTDLNIRTLLNDYSENLPTDISKIADRITIVEYVENQLEIFENVEHDSSLGINYTKIQTNNYLKLFQELNKINQGVSPNYIRKYQHLLKKIIVSKGEGGELDTFLTYANNIDSLPESYKNSNMAVAIGDRGNLFVIPNLIDYLQDYMTESDNISLQIATQFIINQQPNANTPSSRLLKMIVSSSDIHLTSREKDKMSRRLSHSLTLKECIEKISINKSDIQYKNYTLTQVLSSSSLSELNKVRIISKNINNYTNNDLREFIINIALPKFTEIYNSGKDKNGLLSAYRKLFVMYDLKINGDITTDIKKSPKLIN